MLTPRDEDGATAGGIALSGVGADEAKPSPENEHRSGGGEDNFMPEGDVHAVEDKSHAIGVLRHLSAEGSDKPAVVGWVALHAPEPRLL